MSLRLGAFVRSLHTSVPVQARAKYMKKINRLHKHWAKELFRPKPEYVDPVLGKTQVPFLERVRATINQSENQIDQLVPEETSKLLFGAEQAAKKRTGHAHDEAVSAAEARKREIFARLVSLNNSNQQQYKKHAVQLAVKEFERFPGDTGSSEVQAAVLTMRIQFLAAHVKDTKKDVQSKRKLEHLVQTRRNTLLYLKRVDQERYMWTIEKLGLSDEAVTGEFHMSRQYLFKTQFYGEHTLPLKKTKKDTRGLRKFEQRKAKALKYLAHNNPDMAL